MISKRVIIIDDKDQSAIIDGLIHRARAAGIDLSCIRFNPNTAQLRKEVINEKGDTDFVIDIDQVILSLKTPTYLEQKVDLIACDYNFSDDYVNGLDLSLRIRGIRTNMPILFYSEEGDLFEKKLYGLEKIKQLIRVKFESFIKRNEYPDAVLRLLQQPVSLENQLVAELQPFRSLKCNEGFPSFEGFTLKEVIDEIDNGTHLGKKFIDEMLQLTVATIVQISYE